MAVTLITGASSGLGAALAPQLAADGDKVVLAARRVEPMQAVVEQIRAAGGEAMAVALDVTDRDACHTAAKTIAEAWGPVETLVANAGVGQTMDADHFDAELVRWMFDVNVQGMVNTIEAVLPPMLAAGRGHIVGIGSLAGYRGMPGSATYCASKAAVRVFLEGLRVELRGRGIAVTHVAPGFVETPMTDRNQFEMPFLMPVEEGAAHVRRAIRKQPAHYAFPWQMAAVLGAGRALPAGIWDRVMASRQPEKLPGD